MKLFINDCLILELTAQKHAKELMEALDQNRIHLSKYLPWVDSMQTIDDFHTYIKKCQSLYRDQKEVSFVIFWHQKVVGRIGIHYLNAHNKSGAIGYWITKDTQGHGIIHQSCKILISFCFDKLKLNRIELKAATDNVRSRAIAEKLGFTQEGILRQAEKVNDTFHDLAVYSLLRQEWT